MKRVFVITLGLFCFLVTSNTTYAQGAAQEISYDAEYARTKHTTIRQEILGGQGCIYKEPYVSNNPLKSNDYRIEAIPPPYQPVTGASQPKVTPGFDFWTGGGIDTIWYCPPGTLDKLRDANGNFAKELTAADEDPVSAGEQIAIMVIGRLFWVFGVVGSWFVYIAGQLLTPLLTVKSFITNPLVTKGWPFVQGLANIGFILAMLFIAATTTLRIETFNARRMIPRLLIAALLINFSLIIGGVLIDASRLVMAVLVRTMTAGNVSTLAKSILDSSNLIQGAYDTSNLGLVGLKTGVQSWSWLKGVALSTIMIWAVGVSFMVITIGLIIRYVMLILLLIISPIAYLTFALPKAEGVARSWWKNFIKYVIYGPVALFTLTLIVVVGQMYAEGKNALGAKADGSVIDTMIQIIIVCALAVGAALAGKQLGTMGAASTVGFVKNRTQQAARFGGGVIYKQTGLKDAVDSYKKEREKAAKKRSAGSIGTTIGKRTAKGVSSVQDTTSAVATGALVGGLAGGPLGAAAGVVAGVGAKRYAAGKESRDRANSFNSRNAFAPTQAGRNELQNSDELNIATLGKAENVKNMHRETVSDVVNRGSDNQRTALAAGIGNMKEAPSDAKDDDGFFAATINPSLTVVNEANQRIAQADTVIHSSTATDAEKNAARADQEAAKKTKDSAMAILTSLANNKNLVKEMDGETQATLGSVDSKVMIDVLKTVKNLDEDESK